MLWIIERSKLGFQWNRIFKYSHNSWFGVFCSGCGGRFLPDYPSLHCWKLVNHTVASVPVKLVNIYKISWCESAINRWHNQNEITHTICSFLTHWGRATHKCVNELTIIGPDNGLSPVAWSVPSHYLNQCWNIVNSNIRNKFQWNFKRNSFIFIQENPFENVVWKMASILSRPQCV